MRKIRTSAVFIAEVRSFSPCMSICMSCCGRLILLLSLSFEKRYKAATFFNSFMMERLMKSLIVVPVLATKAATRE